MRLWEDDDTVGGGALLFLDLGEHFQNIHESKFVAALRTITDLFSVLVSRKFQSDHGHHDPFHDWRTPDISC